jgi:hypothetical protein
MNFWDFASSNPWLTCALFWIVGETIVEVFKAIFRPKAKLDKK